MPTRNAYPLCCGASIFTGFEEDPEKVSGYAAFNFYDESGRQIAKLSYGYDETGKELQLPKEYTSWGYVKQSKWLNENYAYYDTRTKKKVGDRQGYALDEKGEKIPRIAVDALKQELEKHRKSYPTHFYSCILTDRQIKKHPRWLNVLKEMGFEFKLSFMNAVHAERERLYFFVLVTDDKGKCKGDFNVPPPGWNEISADGCEPTLLQTVKRTVTRRKAA
jgi:hypothetical protein